MPPPPTLPKPSIWHMLGGLYLSFPISTIWIALKHQITNKKQNSKHLDLRVSETVQQCILQIRFILMDKRREGGQGLIMHILYITI